MTRHHYQPRPQALAATPHQEHLLLLGLLLKQALLALKLMLLVLVLLVLVLPLLLRLSAPPACCCQRQHLLQRVTVG
jgi:hypothetical protein